MSTERVFVDISTVRIHNYLDRTYELSLIRGASALLAEATDPEAVQGAADSDFPAGCVFICEEAGESESLIHLEMQCRCGACEAPAVARWGVRYLRLRVPAADFRAVWGRASDYSSFASSSQHDEGQDGGRLESVAPDVELTMLATCESCRRGYAGPQGDCLDCTERRAAASRRSPRSVERRLLDRLGLTDFDVVRDFKQLAKLGPESRDPSDPGGRVLKTNHLATVYIDGNRFRDMFSKAAEFSRDNPFSMEILSRGIGEAVWDALTKAADDVLDVHNALRPDAKDRLPLIPHIVAADDLCVSLPAAYGWLFVVSYCEHFAAATSEVVRRAGHGWTPPKEQSSLDLLTLVPPATASGSLVIAHEKEPFGFCLAAAEDLLTQAKTQFDGREAALMWLDVTREGSAPPASRTAMRIATLESELLDDLADLPQSLRRNLTTETSEDRHDTAARLAQRARRLGLFDRGKHAAIAEGLHKFRSDPETFLDHVAVSDWWMR